MSSLSDGLTNAGNDGGTHPPNEEIVDALDGSENVINHLTNRLSSQLNAP